MIDYVRNNSAVFSYPSGRINNPSKGLDSDCGVRRQPSGVSPTLKPRKHTIESTAHMARQDRLLRGEINNMHYGIFRIANKLLYPLCPRKLENRLQRPNIPYNYTAIDASTTGIRRLEF